MLSSPLQWPLLVIGIAGLAVLTWVAIMMAYRQNVQRLRRYGALAMRVSTTCLGGLIFIDFAAIYLIGRTQMVGLRFTLGMLAWMVLVLLPLVWLVRRVRRHRGWLDSGQTAGATEDDAER